MLEGLALYADPNFKVLAASYPYFAKRLLTDPNPYLRDALIELLFKDGKFRFILILAISDCKKLRDKISYVMVICRWNRLENLLVEGRKDRDFSAKDALQPVLKLLLGPGGEELRILVIRETVRVTEAVILGSLMDTYSSLPDFMRDLVANGTPSGPFLLSDAEQKSMLELRGRVLRIWALLQSSTNFDPSFLQPILQVRRFTFMSTYVVLIIRLWGAVLEK